MIVKMLIASILFCAPQDEKKKTLEERLTELENKLTKLEARKESLTKKNAELKNQLAAVAKMRRHPYDLPFETAANSGPLSPADLPVSVILFEGD